MENGSHERVLLLLIHDFLHHLELCHVLAHLQHHIVQLSVAYKHLLHQRAHVVDPAQRVSAHRLRMHGDRMHLTLGYFALRHEPDHQLYGRVMVQRLILREIHLPAMRALPEEERTVAYLRLEFRILRHIYASVYQYLMLLPALAARRQSFVND